MIMRKSNGERLCEAFAETFEGGGWADAPAWDDFDDRQQDRWNRTAEIFLLNVAVNMEPDALTTPEPPPSPQQVEGEG